jgi:hypothetical protein
MQEAGIERAHVEYSDTGSCRNRMGAPRYEPAGVPVPEALSRLVATLADRCVPPPQPSRHVFMSRHETVTIDPQQVPRARLLREAVIFGKVAVAARDDSELMVIDRALRSRSVEEIKVGFKLDRDDGATLKYFQVTPMPVVLPAELVRRVGSWATGIAARQPIEPTVRWVGGFVLFEVDRAMATLHHRTRRMVFAERSID